MKIRAYIQFLKVNWEYIVLGVGILLGLVILWLGFFFDPGEIEPPPSSQNQLERRPMLSASALDFLNDEARAKREMMANPFSIPIKAPAVKAQPVRSTPQPARQVRPPQRQAPRRPPARPAQAKPAVKPAQPPAAKPAPAPQPPKPKSVKATLKYMFRNVKQDGTPVALVTLTIDKEEKTFMLSVGEKKHGLQVLDVTDERLTLKDARSKKNVILDMNQEGAVWVFKE